MITSILDNHSHTLADLADSCGINYNAIAPYLHQQTHGKPLTRGIHKSNEYRGKVYCHISHKEYAGKTYPTITFGTFKHGGITETFNGYREVMEARGYSDSYIQKQQPKPPRRETIVPIESLEKWKIDALNKARAAFDSATSANVLTHDYVVSKGLNVDGCDIRRGVGKYGDCLMIAVVDSIGAVIGYQQIYAQNISGKNTNKYFIGRTGGGFVVIGDKSKIPFGAIYCEGLATGLKIYHSDGATKEELKNNRKTPVVVCLSASNMRNVVANHANEFGADNIEVYPDNDCGKENGNTGIFVALEICKENGIETYRVPVSKNGAACDFAETLKFNDYAIPKKRIDYAAALLKVCPKQSIKRYWQRYAFALIENAPSELRSVDDCVNAVIAITESRGIDVKQDVHNLISRKFQQRINEMRKLKTITDKSVFNEVLNVDGLTPSEVATEIELETMFNKVMVFDNAGMGGNKTNRYIAYSKGKKGGIAVITPLITVCKDLIERFNKAGTDILDYQDLSPAFLDAHSRKVNAVFCINSITKKGNFAQNFSHLFLDEAVGLYDSIFDDTGTNAKQQAAIIEVLREAFANAESIVISDAGLADKHVKFYQSLCENKKTILLETTPQLSEKNHYLLKNHSHAHEFILKDVISGRGCVVACDSVSGAIAVKEYLIKNGVDYQIDINRVLLATGENCGEEDVSNFIEKPNDNASRWDVIIHSPIIKSGTSIEYAGYESTYLLYGGVIGTSDAMQMLGRARATKNVYVSFGNRLKKDRVTDVEMLMKAEVESHATELTNKGYDIKAADLIAQRDDLASLRHEFTASKNADLNDFRNNFMLFAEITGRVFTRIESDTESDMKLTKAVKATRVENRFNAKVLTETEYKIISNSNKPTQAETDAKKRYDTVLMAYGAENITSDSVISIQDIENELDGMADVLNAFEFISTETSELKALDKADIQNDCFKFSRVKLQKALIEVLVPLQKANDNGGITRKDFNKACDKLEKHAGILSLATFGAGKLRLGNFRKINRIRAGATVGNFVKKIGYEINDISKSNVNRKYEIKQNGDILRYAMNRKGCSLSEYRR